jgi:queuine tRNA-ribosyltransferase
VPFSFSVSARDGAARYGVMETSHGAVPTPAFMPVGTQGAVKGLAPQALAAEGAPIFLANLYHLAMRPGIEAIEKVGGLHAFCGWSRALITDSGGFQVYSLSALRRVDDDGVSFRSHIDGSTCRFTPESVIDWQRRLGVDIAMMLDECPPWPCPEARVEAALERTNAWARRARAVWDESNGAVFGIVQGGVHPRLRERGVAALEPLEFSGYAIGGVSVGEPLADRRAVVAATAPLLPADKPRYLMGVGTPLDIGHAVLHGVDLFDCVLPSRNARHGVLYTWDGVLRIKNARFREDPRPVSRDCPCACCCQAPRALLHHLLRAGEATGTVLATMHNIRFFLDFVAQLREAIASGEAGPWLAEMERRFVADDVARDSSP